MQQTWIELASVSQRLVDPTGTQIMNKYSGIYGNKIAFGNKINLGTTLRRVLYSRWVKGIQQLFLRAKPFGARFCDKRQACIFLGPIMEIMWAKEGRKEGPILLCQSMEGTEEIPYA